MTGWYSAGLAMLFLVVAAVLVTHRTHRSQVNIATVSNPAQLSARARLSYFKQLSSVGRSYR